MALSVIRGMQPRIRELAGELIDGFAGKGRCDFTAEYAEVFPIRIFLALVGIPMEDAGKIRFLATCMTRPGQPLTFEEAKAEFFAYCEPIVRARRETPGDDLISQMVNADMGGRQLSHEEALALTTQVLIAGVDTVVNFLGFVMLFLARDADARRYLASASDVQVLQATHELFRRFGLVIIARMVREDMEFAGAQLKAGELVCIPTQIHGLDDRINPDPMKVDFARRDARHSGFGSGPHMCPGQELARAEVAITIEEWLKRIPEFRLAADADTHCSGGIVGQVNRVVLEWDI